MVAAGCGDNILRSDAGSTCTDLTQPTSCGACDNVCAEPNTTQHNVVATCEHASCALQCSAGFGDCDGDFAGDGCETALDALPSCGGCSGLNAQGDPVDTCNDGNDC